LPKRLTKYRDLEKIRDALGVRFALGRQSEHGFEEVGNVEARRELSHHLRLFVPGVPEGVDNAHRSHHFIFSRQILVWTSSDQKSELTSYDLDSFLYAGM
jgi:hypothetical protein